MIGVNEHPFSGKALRAVAGHGVTMIEVSMSYLGVEFDLTAVVEPRGNTTVGS